MVLSFSFWLDVIGIKKRRPPCGSGAGGASMSGLGCSGRRRLAGALGESAEGLGIAHGDVGQHLAVQLDPRQAHPVDELRVGHAVLPRGRVDAGDPQAPEVALAVAAVAVGVLIGLEDRFLGALVVRVRLAAVALGLLENGAALLARIDGALDAAHFAFPIPNSLRTRLASLPEIATSLRKPRFRLGDFFSRMWLEKA